MLLSAYMVCPQCASWREVCVCVCGEYVVVVVVCARDAQSLGWLAGWLDCVVVATIDGDGGLLRQLLQIDEAVRAWAWRDLGAECLRHSHSALSAGVRSGRYERKE